VPAPTSSTPASKKGVPSQKQLQERFDFLKGAPVEGQYTHNLKVTIKPFGKEVL
jgi:hypothetical protein